MELPVTTRLSSEDRTTHSTLLSSEAITCWLEGGRSSDSAVDTPDMPDTVVDMPDMPDTAVDMAEAVTVADLSTDRFSGGTREWLMNEARMLQ